MLLQLGLAPPEVDRFEQAARAACKMESVAFWRLIQQVPM